MAARNLLLFPRGKTARAGELAAAIRLAIYFKFPGLHCTEPARKIAGAVSKTYKKCRIISFKFTFFKLRKSMLTYTYNRSYNKLHTVKRLKYNLLK